jgi:hypothetical protein
MLSGCAQNCFAADGSGIKQGLISNSFVSAALLDMYVKCGELEDVQCVFDELSYIDLVLWTTMNVAYTQNGNPLDALLHMYVKLCQIYLTKCNHFCQHTI